MNRIKTVGLAVLALACCAALFAVSASAAQFQYESEEYPAPISGSNEPGPHHIVTTNGNIQCSVATLSGEMSEPGETITLSPALSKCLAVGASFNINGCKYRFSAGAEIGEGSFEGSMDITECNKYVLFGKTFEREMVLSVAGFCQANFAIPSQSGIPVQYLNRGGELEVSIHPWFEGNGLVTKCNNAVHNDGVYEGTWLIPGLRIE